MKYIFTLLLSSLLLLSHISTFATTSDVIDASGSANISGGTNLVSDVTLKLVSVTAVDNLHLNVIFSEGVDLKTMKLKVTKQSDNSTLKIASLTGSTNDISTVVVNLDTELLEGSAYTLTVVSAIGDDGAVITDGALALRDFITPVPLKKYEVTMNAPSNPNAVMVQSSTGNAAVSGLPNIRPVDTSSETATGKNQAIPPTKELPLTGMNPLFLLIIILPLAFFFMRKKAL